MIDINKIIKQISDEEHIDIQIVDKICKHVFLCTESLMKDERDTRDILFNGLFKFKLKTRFKENKNKKYSSK